MTFPAFIRNTAFTMTRLVAGAILSLVLSSYLARVLGPAGNGQYALAILLPVMAATIGNLGVGATSVYFVSNRSFPIAEIISKNILVTLVAASVAGAAGLLVALRYDEMLFPGVPFRVLAIVLSGIFPFMLFTSLVQVFRGKQNFKSYGILSILPVAINPALLLLVSVVGVSVEAAVICWLSSYVIALLVTLFALRTELRCVLHSVRAKSDYLSQAMRYGITSHLSNIATFLHYRIDIYVLGAFWGAGAAGIYAVAVPATEVVWLVSNAVSAVLLPFVSAAGSESPSSRNITPVVARVVLAISALIGGVLYLGSSYVIKLLFGDPYAQAAEVLRLLMPGVVCWSVARVLCNDMAGRGRPGINLIISLLALIVNLAVVFLLVPRFGINGAALASAISYVTFSFATLLAYSQLTKTAISEVLFLQKVDFIILRKALHRRASRG